ncbi:Alpha-mannosidase [Hibiscus syriacus]|uniref:Alpha-mannosidase n=1 Tax=Hibiscus syriacus TaxID=106335 RepID=A0A6A3B7U2_HIBSY|nr:Alpha-mannosidase [Hibiscus syriacus]
MAIHGAWILITLMSIWCVESKYMVYNTTSKIVPGKLNVHLVAHTHDDVGWLKTVDQYYVGSNNSIQGACVQNVLDSIVPALLADKNRKFIYAFFQRWWRDQSETVQEIVKQLINSGQLELINGGMCMHDEAAPHYVDMIDQTTLGHRFIKQEFNITPRIGWQIDPFGHSAVQGYLLSAEVGFDSLFFGRIDYQDRAKRKDEKSLEVVWRGSKSLGSSAQIFAGAFPENYEPPSNFYYEVDDDSPIVQDNMELFDYNVPERVNEFVAAALSQDGRVNALYSTPSIYTDAKYATNEAWPLKTGDYFPYADRINAYWTGYFTSRPALKGYVRTMSGYYLAARQLEFFKGKSKAGLNTDYLADALALAQHHDAVSGTSKQHVANDYAKRLSIGYEKCPLLNISYCPASEVDLSNGKNLVVVVYNSLGWKREEVIRIPVIDENVIVKDHGGNEIKSQLLPFQKASLDLRNYYSMAYLGKSPSVTPKYWLAFSASAPPLGLNTYFISSDKRKETTIAAPSKYHVAYGSKGKKDVIKVGPGNLKLVYSANQPKLIGYVSSKKMIKESVRQSYSFYAGATDIQQASGAYIFRPNGTYSTKPDDQITRVYKEKEYAEFEFTVGPIPINDGIGKEVVTQISTPMKTNRTFYTDSSGRDFLERIRDYRNDWTLDVNQPIAGNYYPINLGMYMKDDNKELSVLVDRSVGGASIKDGQLELMLHRRLLRDDGRGVAEALNETVCVLNKCSGLTIVGKYYLRIDPLREGAKWRRSFGQEIYSPFLLAFTEQGGDELTNSHVSSFSGMDPSYVLPDNVAMITLEELDDGKVLLRFAHLYEVGEDKDLSVMARVQLKKVFAHKKINKVTEMSLSANQGRTEMEKKRLVWKVEGSSEESPKVVRGGPVDPATLVVELAPMEIRTFVIELE